MVNIHEKQIDELMPYENKPVKSPEHPTMKPVALCAKLIFNSSLEGNIVYEPFGGSGTTLIAAEQINRTCYAVELDLKYCDVIIRRWEKLTNDKARRLA
jgi:DNA modification methylase